MSGRASRSGGGTGRSTRASFVDLLTAQVVPLAASVATTFATASLLGVAERGRLSLIVSTGSLIGSIAYLSIQVGVVRSFRAGDPTSVGRGVRFAAVVGVVIAVLATAVALLFPRLQAGGFDAATLWMAGIGGAVITINLAALRIRQGLGQSALFRNGWLIQSLVYLAIGIPVAFLTRSAYVTAACWLAALIASTVFVLMHRAPSPSGAGARTPLRRIVSDSLPAHVALVGQQVMHSGDIVILGLVAGTSAVGLYSVAVPIAGLIWVVSEALSLLAFQLSAGSDDASSSMHRRRLGRLNLVFGSAAAIVIAIASFTVLPWLLPAYSGAGVLVVLLLPGVVIQGYARISLSSILSHARASRLMVIGVGSAVLSLIYIPAAIQFGAVGAAIGSTIIYILQTVLVMAIIRRDRVGQNSEPVTAGEPT